MHTPRIEESFEHALAGTPYRFSRVLGRGGMSTVLEAEHTGLAKPVVVKLLHPELSARADLVDRLRIEAQALARLAHPNLVSVSDFGRTPSGLSYLVMERLEGRTLFQELRARGHLPVNEALDLMAQALSGLHAAHVAGLVHRDVKPENLFVATGAGGRTLKVLDFGIAKLADDAALSGVAPPRFSTQEGAAIGTPHFAAPEQLAGGIVTPATDVYAAGLVLYELVTGRHPFQDHRTADAIHHAQMLEMPPLPSRLAPQPIPPELDRAVMRAIAKAPADRFPSAAAFAAELEAIRAGTAATADSRAASTLASGPADSRAAAPTLQSRVAPVTSAPTLASAGVATLHSAASSDDAPTVALPPATAAMSAPPMTVASAPPATTTSRPAPRTDGVGALAIVLGLVAALWQLASALFGVQTLFDPVGVVTALRSAPPDPDSIETLMRAAGAVTVLKSLLLASAALPLALVGVALVRHAPRGPLWLRRWSSWAIVAVVLAGLADVALVVPLQQMVFAHVPAPPGGEAAQDVGLAVGTLGLIAAPLVELGLVIGLRIWANRLSAARAP